VPDENHEKQQPAARSKTKRPPPRASKWVRTALVAVGLTIVAVFAVAFYANPYNPDGSPRSMATHTTLGLPPCNFVELTGKPCPSCGMTTSFALLVRGDVGNSLKANWAGTILAVLSAALIVWCFAGAVGAKLYFIPRDRGETILTVFVGAFLILMTVRWVAALVG